MLARYFGVPLGEIASREKQLVPSIVQKITLFIYKQGIDIEGIFRVNGNAKSLEKLRSAFDKLGNADLKTCSDSMTIAALLKVFLRELPDGLIPQRLTSSFVNAQDICVRDPQECLYMMKQLLSQLPKENYATLKYLIAFLVLVTLEEETNKMNAMALAIVFGPILFRCSTGFQGLKEQSVTNYITLTFIMKYDVLFLNNGETSPYSPQFILTDCIKPLGLETRLVPVVSLSLADADTAHDDDDDSLCEQSLSPSSLPVDSESSETGSALASNLSAQLQQAIHDAVDRYVFGKEVVNGSDNSESEQERDHRGIWPLKEEVKKMPQLKEVEAGAKGSVKPSDASAANTKAAEFDVLDSKQSTGSSVHAKTAGEDQKDNDEKLTESSDDTSSDSDTPPPLFPRLAKSASKSSELTDKLKNHTRPAKSGHIAAGIGKPRLPSPPAVPSESGASHGRIVTASTDEGVVDDNTLTFRRLNKQIQAAKRKIKEFEADFEEEHGHKPSMSEKSAFGDIKEYMSEIDMARKRLSELRADPSGAQVKDSKPMHSGQHSGERDDRRAFSSMKNTLVLLEHKLDEKRREARRPLELERMSLEELREEKFCVQRVLLHFEKLHGRPTSFEEKQLMHPLYERYRQIKRRLEKPSLSDQSNEDSNEESGSDSGEHNNGNIVANTSFVSSATYSTVATDNTMKAYPRQSSKSSSRDNHNGEVVDDWNTSSDGVNYHQLTLSELQYEHEKLQQFKKRLQIELNNFEQAFVKKFGRRLHREDKLAKESEYRQYRAVKAKLKLMEALMEKRSHAKKSGAS